jgi:hypothetical protein
MNFVKQIARGLGQNTIFAFLSETKFWNFNRKVFVSDGGTSFHKTKYVNLEYWPTFSKNKGRAEICKGFYIVILYPSIGRVLYRRYYVCAVSQTGLLGGPV